jgi:hypothetical protein
VDYRYRVDGPSYRGWGTGRRAHEHVADLRREDSVAIEYAPTRSRRAPAARAALGGVTQSVRVRWRGGVLDELAAIVEQADVETTST